MKNGNGNGNGARHYGVVREYNNVRGVGYIELDDGGEHAFVRYSWIGGAGVRSLTAGQRVSFELDRDGQSLNALRVLEA
ncbi:MAG: cold shock domain-containing protein [Anaerolineae bacterium]|nr:cold shock domain-containing protein [Anaerolineae bacterium]